MSKPFNEFSKARTRLCGCVLAGGQSSRMGCDKALLKPYGPNGPTMLEHAYKLLQNLCEKCFVSTQKGRAYPPYPCIFDETPGLGPIGGVLNLLLHAQKWGLGGIFVLACDLPLMRLDILERLTKLDYKNAAGCFFINARSGKVEMLAGIYTLKAIPYLISGINQKKFGLYSALTPENMHLLAYAEKDAPAFFNCNRVQDLALKPACQDL